MQSLFLSVHTDPEISELRRTVFCSLKISLHAPRGGCGDAMDDEGVYQNKRLRMSPPLSPNIDEEDAMDVMPAARESRAASDASSDWGDWADRQVAQGDTPGDAGVAAAREASAVDGGGKNDQDDQWVRKQMEQPSAVLAADNRAWDYVLQMVVDEGEVRT